MSDTAEMRAWLRENHPELNVGERGRINPAARGIYEDEVLFSETAETPPSESGFVPLVTEGDGEVPLPFEETPPQKPEKKGWFGRKREAREPRRRVSTASLVGLGYAAVGGILQKNQALVPVGRCLSMQAPVAGEIADGVVKGTMLDKVLQPLARVGDKGEEVFALLGPPALTMAICAQPELYPVLAPIMAEALKSWVVIAGPKIKRARAKQEKLQAELGEDWGTTIETMMGEIFAPIAEDRGAPEPAGV